MVTWAGKVGEKCRAPASAMARSSGAADAGVGTSHQATPGHTEAEVVLALVGGEEGERTHFK